MANYALVSLAWASPGFWKILSDLDKLWTNCKNNWKYVIAMTVPSGRPAGA